MSVGAPRNILRRCRAVRYAAEAYVLSWGGQGHGRLGGMHRHEPIGALGSEGRGGGEGGRWDARGRGERGEAGMRKRARS